ncbi:bifunctional demethylmenaquinone methyltransferase/2-methoxy-6-polyprenyl-1,4-benzoquinol methylase UbiE [Inquilinus sp. CAU 1745]|uniref:bifunctional demethylmenaquinone methyltransferase/2-methoxy-6-polyprenyl-1,4-benzoquinol methylase UbiE n=1 Tax=Inquilinus sp. CAU 1745 TaxID=3140369 RepID=UPI00325B7673
MAQTSRHAAKHPAKHAGGDRDPESRWFGYRSVDPSEKTSLVHGVFASVATRYDIMNDLMSGGIHRVWKARFIDQIRPRPGEFLLDVAGGTGDIAFRFLDRAGGEARAAVCDLTEDMVRVGRDRAIDGGRMRGLDFLVGNAEALPIADRSADVYTIAFGLRNVTHIDAALAEARRVLKPGGRFFCLEFSRVVLPVLSRLYDLYSFNVIPRLGQMVAHDRDSYQYLVESIRQFPPQEELAARMEAAGLARAGLRNLTGGIAAIHCGWRV